MNAHKVGIAGFAGYSGTELVRLLRAHPAVTPVLLRREDAAGAIDAEVPFAVTAGLPQLALSEAALQDAGLAAALLATPPEASMQLAPRLLAAGAKVVDLSGAFRLPAGDYRRWYRAEHGAPELLEEAVYGLPEHNREALPHTRLVANPGCYATAVNLALQPLLAADLIDRRAGVVVDAKSGVSGAGKRPNHKTHFCSVANNFSAYGFYEHRHVGEILRQSGIEEGELSFVVQLLPLRRGILACLHFRLRAEATPGDVLDAYCDRYANEPFVRVYPAGQVPDLHSVVGSPRCHIGVRADAPTGRALVVATLDNLLKGAASQAVQNLNLLLGLPETTGLG